MNGYVTCFWSSSSLLEVCHSHLTPSASSYTIERQRRNCMSPWDMHPDSGWTTTPHHHRALRNCSHICRCRCRRLRSSFHQEMHYSSRKYWWANLQHFHWTLRDEGCTCCFQNQWKRNHNQRSTIDRLQWVVTMKHKCVLFMHTCNT